MTPLAALSIYLAMAISACPVVVALTPVPLGGCVAIALLAGIAGVNML